VDYIQKIPKEETNEEVDHVDRFLFCRNAVGQIDFTSVSLRYAQNLPLALTNVTFHIEAGQRVGIIGRTGAGKSSIFQALLRAHPIETGKIFIDATIDLSKLDPKAVRSMFGVITQTPFLFSGTIRENLQMDNEQISDEEITALLCQAGLSEF
jgi:ABC-type multidrug transport system fused ATPase/permease subunit